MGFIRRIWTNSAGRERKRLSNVLSGLILCRVTMRATRAALLGAGTKRFIDDGLDGTRASAAFGTAAKATVNLLWISRHFRRCAHGIADVMVAQDIAGTDDHEICRTLRGAPHRYLRARRDAKGKAAVSSNSKLSVNADWNESKELHCAGSRLCRRLSAESKQSWEETVFLHRKDVLSSPGERCGFIDNLDIIWNFCRGRPPQHCPLLA